MAKKNYDQDISFVTEIATSQKDEYDEPIYEETLRNTFCREKSISQTEFYQADANGYKPEVKVILAESGEYQSEKKAIYKEVKYSVLRTFVNEEGEFEVTLYKGVNKNVTT